MKSMGIQSVSRFPFPSPPRPQALAAAVRMLVNIGALEKRAVSDASGAVVREVEDMTPLGERLVKLPLHPRLGKMIILGGCVRCRAFVAACGAAAGVTRANMWGMRADLHCCTTRSPR